MMNQIMAGCDVTEKQYFMKMRVQKQNGNKGINNKDSHKMS